MGLGLSFGRFSAGSGSRNTTANNRNEHSGAENKSGLSSLSSLKGETAGSLASLQGETAGSLAFMGETAGSLASLQGETAGSLAFFGETAGSLAFDSSDSSDGGFCTFA